MRGFNEFVKKLSILLHFRHLKFQNILMAPFLKKLGCCLKWCRPKNHRLYMLIWHIMIIPPVEFFIKDIQKHVFCSDATFFTNLLTPQKRTLFLDYCMWVVNSWKSWKPYENHEHFNEFSRFTSPNSLLLFHLILPFHWLVSFMFNGYFCGYLTLS